MVDGAARGHPAAGALWPAYLPQGFDTFAQSSPCCCPALAENTASVENATATTMATAAAVMAIVCFISEIPPLQAVQGFHLGTGRPTCDDRHMRLRVSLAALAAALGGWAIALAIWKPGELTLPVAVHLAIGWSFVAAGLVAWARRPENRTGLLMTLTGVVWFGRDFDSFGFSPATRLSELSQNLFLALLAHQVVVFPDGVTRSRRERALVAAIYLLAVPGYAVSEIGPTVNDVLSALGIVLAVAAVAIIVDRWRSASAPRRRALEPLLWAGPPTLAVVAASIAKDYLDLSVSATGDAVLDWCALAYTLIPAAFLAGVLRTRLHRGALAELVLELSDASPAHARDALARSLGDPSLELAFWIPERGRYVDSQGKPFEVPQDRAVTELDGVAALVYDPSLLEDIELVRAAGAAARLTRAGGARPTCRRTDRPWNRAGALRVAEDGRGARTKHLQEARAAVGDDRKPPRPRRTRLPTRAPAMSR